MQDVFVAMKTDLIYHQDDIAELKISLSSGNFNDVNLSVRGIPIHLWESS
jgi:hypothetical protein